MAKSKTAVVKCENCGADLAWNATKATLACPYCDSEKEVEKRASNFRNYYDYTKEGYVEETSIVYLCPNCHAETTIDNFDTAMSCPFCGATNIVKGEALSGLKPDSILPFRLAKQDALNFGKKWMKKKLFAPSKCKKNFSPEKFKGVYIPNFSFNTDTVSTYAGQLGEYYYVTVGSGEHKHTERRVRWYNVSGELDKSFKDLLVECSTHIDQKQLGKISPFDLVSNEAYREEYLAGYAAERYNTSLKDSFGIAKTFIEPSIRRDILARYKADTVGYLNVSTIYTEIMFKYILLPVWICSYKYKQKLYQYIVNGRTGKSTGKSPVSPLRVLVAILLGLGAIALLIWGLASGGVIDVGMDLIFNEFKLLN